MTNVDSILKSRDITLPTKVCIIEAMVFPVVKYECESCTIQKAERRRIDAFELWCWRKLLRVPWTTKNQTNHSKGNQSWIFTGRTDAKAEVPILWSPDVKNSLISEDPDVGKDWRQKDEMTEDETVGWHHQLNGNESGQAPEDGNGEGSLVCCSSWGQKELDKAKRLSWTELKQGPTVQLKNY